MNDVQNGTQLQFNSPIDSHAIHFSIRLNRLHSDDPINRVKCFLFRSPFNSNCFFKELNPFSGLTCQQFLKALVAIKLITKHLTSRSTFFAELFSFAKNNPRLIDDLVADRFTFTFCPFG
jgi:hypothetical protein